MGGCRGETGSRTEIEMRLAELNRLHRQLEKRNERFRNLREDAMAAKIDDIRRLLNLIYRSAPGVISTFDTALPRRPSRRRPRRKPRHN